MVHRVSLYRTFRGLAMGDQVGELDPRTVRTKLAASGQEWHSHASPSYNHRWCCHIGGHVPACLLQVPADETVPQGVSGGITCSGRALLPCPRADVGTCRWHRRDNLTLPVGEATR